MPNSKFVINGISSHQWSSVIPTLSACGTSPSVKGTDNDFEITVGSTTTGCTATFGGTYQDAICEPTNQSGTANSMSYTVSKTAVVLSQTGLGGELIDVHCDFKN